LSLDGCGQDRRIVKAKTAAYATLGWLTYRVGKHLARRKLREKLGAR
jgi:hypothetical protein